MKIPRRYDVWPSLIHPVYNTQTNLYYSLNVSKYHVSIAGGCRVFPLLPSRQITLERTGTYTALPHKKWDLILVEESERNQS